MYNAGREDDRPMELAYDRVQWSFLVGTSGVKQTVSATAMLVSSVCFRTKP
jgi:hypothetical protein